jgi:DNA polymerase-1
MPGYISIDFETSIQYDDIQVPLKGKKNKGKFKTVRKNGLHGPSWKDPKNDIYSIIYGDKPDNIKMVHSEKGFKRKLTKEVGEMLLKSHTIIGTNLKFDLGYVWNDRYMQKFLRNGGKVWDCQIAAYLLGGQRWQFPSLGEMQAVILGKKTKVGAITKLFKRCIGANEIIARRQERKFWWKAYKYYGIEDGKTPMLIMQKQYKEAKEKGMLPIIELYNQYLLALIMIEVNGILVDISATEKLYKEFSLEVVKYLEIATDIVKPLWVGLNLPALNVNSSVHSALLLFGGDIRVQVRRGTGVLNKTGNNKGKEKTKLFEELIHIKGFGLDPSKYSRETKKGWSTDKGAIENIYAKCGNPQAIEYCKNLKLSATYKQKISTYLNALLYKSVDGIIRANYNNTETNTSRLSASSPNLQNIPAHGEFGASIPALLIAPPGWSCVSIDFSQLEVLCQAMLSQDWNLCRDIRDGVDFHVKRLCYIEPEYTYTQILQLAKVLKEGDWPDKRSKAKVISFQKAYGAAPESLAKITGLPIELVKQIFEKEDIEYPSVKEFDDNVANEVKRSAVLSRKYHYAVRSTKGNDSKGVPRKFVGDVELLPIRERDKKTYTFVSNEYRHVGFYVSPTGKRYAFLEYGSRKQDGDIFRYYKPTQMKNYAMQGSAGDIQAITTVAMFSLLLKHSDKVKLVNEIHDSKWFLIKNEYLDSILSKLCGIMRNTSQLLKQRFGIDISFNFDVEAKVGKNFADMQVYKEQVV